MADDNVEHLVTGSQNLTPEQVLDDSKHFDLKNVLVIGTDPNNRLIMRSSGILKRDALWLLMHAIDYVRGK